VQNLQTKSLYKILIDSFKQLKSYHKISSNLIFCISRLRRDEILFDTKKNIVKIVINKKRLNIHGDNVIKLMLGKLSEYFNTCPKNGALGLKILVDSINIAGKKTGILLANFFVELIVAYSILLNNPNDLSILRISKERVIEIRDLGDLYIAIILYWKEQLDPRKCSNRDLILIDNLSRFLLKDGIYNWYSWGRKLEKIYNELVEILNKKISKRKSKQIFLRDITKQDIFLFFMSNLIEISRENDGETLEKIIDLYGISNIIDTVAVSDYYHTALKTTHKEFLRIWYRKRARNMFKKLLVNEKSKKYRVNEKKYTISTWKVDDPLDKLDIVLSAYSSPIIIPNITTKKHDQIIYHRKKINELRESPVMLVLDSSRSMSSITDKNLGEEQISSKRRSTGVLKYPLGSKFDISLIASFALVEYLLNKNCEISVVNFSGKSISKAWSKNRREIEDILMIYQGDGTVLPVKDILKLIQDKQGVYIIIITDAEIHNKNETKKLLEILIRGNHKLIMFKIGRERGEQNEIAEIIKKKGGILYNISQISQIPKVITEKVPF